MASLIGSGSGSGSGSGALPALAADSSLHAALPACDEALVLQALRLIITAEVAEPAAAESARHRLESWPQRSAAHRSAWAEAQRRAALIAQAAPALRQQLRNPVDPAGRKAVGPDRARRSLLGLAGTGLAVAGAAGLAGWWSWRESQPLYAGRWRSGRGELLRVGLPDATAGSVGAPTEFELSPDTALEASLYRQRREARLLAGEAHFAVRADAARPFTVFTRAGRIDVVGTAFSVADRGEAVTVAVEHGRVRFAPGEALDGTRAALVAAIELHGGERLTVRDGQAPGAVQRIAPADVAAWRRGWLVFDDVPLAEAVSAINAFRAVPLVLADDATARLRLTARFRTGDESALLAALPAVLPVRLKAQADGAVRIEARP